MKGTAPKVFRGIKKPTLIGKIKEVKAKNVIKRPTIIGKIKARRVIKKPTLIGKIKKIKVKNVIKKPMLILNNDKHKSYVNPITFNYVLRPICLAALREMKSEDKDKELQQNKDEELQQKFEEVSQKIEKKIISFPSRKALKNYTKSFGIKIFDENDPIIQLNKTNKGVAFLLKEQLNIMKGIKYMETLKLALKKTTIDADKDTITIFKTAYFNSKAKTLINKGEVNESIQKSNQEILNGISVWLSEGSEWTAESVDDQYINIVRYKPLKGPSDIELPPELKNPAKGLINPQNKDNECFRRCHIRHLTHRKYILRGLKRLTNNILKSWIIQTLNFQFHKNITTKSRNRIISILTCLDMNENNRIQFTYQKRNSMICLIYY